jgi:hypothetical protein
MKINTIIFGTTGMVGEGVLDECLNHSDVESVLVINRRPCGITHDKLKEIIHQDFYDFSPIEDQLFGYNACYFCLGVSSVGMIEEDYRRITHDMTMNIAKLLVKNNPQMTFCYVSGAGTDSTENGRSMWARIKGKTENDLMKLPFKDSYMFRPGYIQPIKGLKNTYKIYKVTSPFYPILRILFPKYVVTLKEVGRSMIHAVLQGSDVKVLECEGIRLLANKGIPDEK